MSSRPREFVRRFPGTLALLGTMLLFFALEHALGGATELRAHLRLGALRPDRVAEHREYFRLVMPLFLHHGWVHVLVDTVAFAQVGGLVEGIWGTRRLVLYTLLFGLAAALVSLTMHPLGTDGAVGASGAILGLAGLLLGTSWWGDDDVRDAVSPVRGWLVLAILLAFAVGLGLSLWRPIVDNWGHTGGLATGLLVSLARPEAGRSGSSTTLASAAAMLMLGGALTWTAVAGDRALATMDIDTARLLAVRASQAPGNPATVPVLIQMVDWYERASARQEGAEKYGRLVAKFDEPAVLQFLAAPLFALEDAGRDRGPYLEATLGRWLELEPDDPLPLNAMAWHLVTRVDEAARDPARAERLSRKSLTRIADPASDDAKAMRAQCLDTLSEALYQQQRHAEALDLQREAVDLARALELGELDAIAERLRKIETAAGAG